MYGKLYGAWLKAGMDAWTLGAEASMVIGLRMAKVATGDSAAAKEADLMVSEKVQAAWELQTQLLTAPLGMTPLGATRKTISHYRRKVGANRRRLTR
ncbi:hypothetical protein [Sphingomonas oryzagri]|uniref:Uncharacterized protein n=1 Tax=Sphingomonas oryzagri TaxID=3042314 RepID=A0ABT6N4T8_9SPHN|nr:hypothetical protein [Sphingomonas oryzagri]MDH7639711.1 hypothetical protein [Sphingomonas oryzagri]